MTTYNVPISEEGYRRLREQAQRLQIAPEQVIERLLTSDLLSLITDTDEADLAIPAAGSAEAYAALHRLTTLFSDLTIPNLEQILADPMIELENADLDDLLL